MITSEVALRMDPFTLKTIAKEMREDSRKWKKISLGKLTSESLKIWADQLEGMARIIES